MQMRYRLNRCAKGIRRVIVLEEALLEFRMCPPTEDLDRSTVGIECGIR